MFTGSADELPEVDDQQADEARAAEAADAEAARAAEAAAEERRCRLCKIIVELDRVVAAREAGYAAGLFTMLHSDKMAKSDLLVGVPREQSEWRPAFRCLHA